MLNNNNNKPDNNQKNESKPIVSNSPYVGNININKKLFEKNNSMQIKSDEIKFLGKL